jgi:phosphohistidine phosphatase
VILLAQHGKAYSEAEDPERRLTPEGAAETERVARFLARAGIRVREIVHSGRARARQTAEIFARHLRCSAREETGLGPSDDPGIWASRLSTLDDVMLVGHLPHLSRLASLLLLGDPSREIIKFRYSGVVALVRGAEGRWALAWYATPDLIIE